jgi:ketosteroid isomerase-like protein
MSREAVELAKRSVEAFARRDPDALAAVFHPEAEFHSAFGAMEGNVYRGPSDIRRYLEDIDSIFDDWRLEDVRYLPASDGRVVMPYRIVGTGRGSGFPVEAQIAIVWQARDGLLWRGDVYLDQAEALGSVGLDPVRRTD